MPEGIADLTYRPYEGAMGSARSRWKVVAMATMRGAFRKKSMWILCVISMWYYLAMAAVLYYFQAQALSAQTSGVPGADRAQTMVDQVFANLVWKDQFLHGIGFGNLFYFIIALIIGSGVIANDFRSNALLVYLSKPLSKNDYLFGKWMGVFVPMLIVIAIPHLIFYAYGVMSFADRGFFSNDPWMILKIIAIIILAAAFYASLIIGASSVVRSGRLAAAILAGVYFLSIFFKGLMTMLVGMRLVEGPGREFAEMGTHFSIEGVVRAMAKFVLDTDGSPPFINSARPEQVIGRPPFLFVLLTLGGVIALGLIIARARVKAVEVVK